MMPAPATLMPTNVAELIHAFTVVYLAEGFRPFLFEPGNNRLDILDGKGDMPNTQGIRRKFLDTILVWRPMVFDELYVRLANALAIRHPEKGKGCFHVIEPN